MTALLLTFAVRRLFGRFFFLYAFFYLQDTRFPCFDCPFPRVTSCLLRTVGPRKLFFTFHIFFPVVRSNDVSKVVRMMLSFEFRVFGDSDFFCVEVLIFRCLTSPLTLFCCF